MNGYRSNLAIDTGVSLIHGDRKSACAVAAMLAVVAGLVLATAGTTGCRMFSCGGPARPAEPLQLSLPLWLTAPSGDEQREAPVLLGMKLPPDLTPFGERFASLPPWYVYGTIRCLGAEELLASGTIRTYSMDDGAAEYRHVVDTLRYHVDAQKVAAALASATQALVYARDDLDREVTLRANLRHYYTGFGLFSLSTSAGSDGAAGMESFRADTPPKCEPAGWRETASDYFVTQPGNFNYSDPLGAFRKTEEDAIAELAKGIMVRLAFLEKSGITVGADAREAATKETVKLRLKGVHVLRRSVNLADGSCSVTIGLPKSGVSRVE